MGAAVSTETKSNGQETPQSSADTAKKVVGQPSALIICGPSGVGKGTLISRLMSGTKNFGFSCSHTTRSPRPGEQNGKEYYFTTRQDFERGIAAGEFLEYAFVHGNIYGTSFKAVEDVATSGRCCVLDIDVQGSRKVRASTLAAIFVFIAPPSLAELETRLRGRGTESEEQVQKRLAAAKQELSSMNEEGLFDYIIVNDDLEAAFNKLNTIAKQCLSGKVGPATTERPVTLLTKEDTGNATQDQSSVNEDRTENDCTTMSQQPDSKSAAPIAATTPILNRGINRWRGKVALVTGASAGIGWEICQRLALEGLRVVAVARRKERLEALQQHLVGLGIPIAEFLPVVCDITKEAEVVALPRIVVKRWPAAGIDILVNNAGMGRNNANLFDGKTSSWVEMISTNVLGPCMCTREALLDMKRREQWGHIINVSSLSGHRVPDAANSGSAFYAATKHALRALTEGLRQEARGKQVPLRVTQISPGMVETEFDLVRSFGDKAAAAERYKSFKCLQPEDVADAVVWTLSTPDHVDVNDILIRPVRQEL